MLKNDSEKLISDFEKLKTRGDVASILEINDKSLRYFLYGSKAKNMYSEFYISKKSGGKSVIHAPNEKLKCIQRKLAYILNLIYKPKYCTCGFVPNKNIVTNAEKHLKRKLILNIDLENFFTQINFGRVRGTLMSKPYSVGEQAATTIAQIVCYNGCLPQGAPTSPVISNMVCRSMDNSFMRLAKRYNITYSRYADDLTFSTFSNEFPDGIAKIEDNKIKVGKDIQNILGENNFKINNKKVALRNRNQHQEVTGLTVNRKVNINRIYLKNLRAILYNISKSSVYNEAVKYIEKGLCRNRIILENYKIKNTDNEKKVEDWFKKVIIGKIFFIRQIKGEYDYTYLKFAKEANKVLKDTIFDLSHIDEFMNIIEQSVFVIESDDSQGTCFYTDKLGLVTCLHVLDDEGFYKVHKYFEYPEYIEFLTKQDNMIYSDKKIDYAILQVRDEIYHNFFKIASDIEISIGDIVTVIGYPNFMSGDSPCIESCKVTSKTMSFGATLYTVSGRLVHGSSGGCVINQKNEIIGVIKAGVVSSKSEDDAGKHGFVPINIILEDVLSQQKKTIDKQK